MSSMSECEVTCYDKASGEGWLRQNNVDSNLVKRLTAKEYSCSLSLPQAMRPAVVLLTRLLESRKRSEKMMLRLDDWPHFYHPEMHLFSQLRKSFGETRSLADAPCHVFEPSKAGLLIGMFALTISYQWKATLYAPGGDFIVHNWEGDFLEIYCSDSALSQLARELAIDFGLDYKAEPNTSGFDS
jgi:hypothetical protein